ncbi:MAG: nuclear transport factor 2 family protein [Candidatus Binataceae bacterium]|nr:nuclear transport factor 2 family protein [Candidatus Binataceae bacterium]
MAGDSSLQVDQDYLLKKEAVVAYLFRLCRMLDDFEIKRFVEEFTDDGTYRLIPRDNHERKLPVHVIDDNKSRLIYRTNVITDHWHYERFRETRMLSNVMVEFPSDRNAIAKSNLIIYHTDAEGRTKLHMTCVLEDHLVALDGRWRIKDRIAILESFLPDEAIVVPP